MKSEINKLINATKNPAEKKIIALIYYSGLRVSEIKNLQISDIEKH